MSTRLFTSWVRRGAAAGIVEPDPATGAYPGPATFQPSLILARDGVALPPIAGPALTLMGPGAVAGLNPRAILRTDPAANATGVEDNYLAQIELARPDLPWMFTPAKPNAAGRLSPWMVLIVVEASIELQAGTPLPRISVSDLELPDLSEAWAWAHVQVTVDDPATAPAALNAAYGDAAVSRLLCPRRLRPGTAYLACLTPATRAGAQAGLGLPLDPGPAIAPAWTAGAGQTVVLPVSHSWRFSTGDDGDVKSLVQRLHGVRPTDVAGFGTRTIDVSNPWQSPPQPGAGMTIELDGALGIGVADRVLILENAYYSVISPEGCAAILWKDRANAAKAAAALKITAKDLLKFKLIDDVVPEPLGGAHTDAAGTAANLKTHLLKHLEEVLALPVAERLKVRYDKFRAHGHFTEKTESAESHAVPQAAG